LGIAPNSEYVKENNLLRRSLMKFIPAVLAAVLIISGCGKNDELEKRNAELQTKHSQLEQELASRDEYIENITSSVNEVYSNLETIRSKEKLVMNESNQLEAAKKLTREEIRQRLLSEISSIDTTLQKNRKKIDDLQSKVNSYRAQFASLRVLVTNLKKTIEEREASIAQLELKVKGLETEVGEKTQMLAERDSTITGQRATIEAQTHKMNTGFYVVGTRKDLESKGIIRNEGGFLWGLLGSTTVLASGFNHEYFRPINKWAEKTIEVKGNINEIIPKREAQFYSMKEPFNHQSVLSIVEPTKFWQDNYLVIITD
jgi:outer membrane murein-binding lipoprotein Lpp